MKRKSCSLLTVNYFVFYYYYLQFEFFFFFFTPMPDARCSNEEVFIKVLILDAYDIIMLMLSLVDSDRSSTMIFGFFMALSMCFDSICCCCCFPSAIKYDFECLKLPESVCQCHSAGLFIFTSFGWFLLWIFESILHYISGHEYDFLL